MGSDLLSKHDELKDYTKESEKEYNLHEANERILRLESALVNCVADKCLLKYKIQKLEERLEITHEWMCDPNDPEGLIRVEIPQKERDNAIDGIECRDCTIKLQDEHIAKQTKRIQELEDKIKQLEEREELRKQLENVQFKDTTLRDH